MHAVTSVDINGSGPDKAWRIRVSYAPQTDTLSVLWMPFTGKRELRPVQGFSAPVYEDRYDENVQVSGKHPARVQNVLDIMVSSQGAVIARGVHIRNASAYRIHMHNALTLEELLVSMTKNRHIDDLRVLVPDLLDKIGFVPTQLFVSMLSALPKALAAA